MTSLLIKEAVNQSVDNMGFYNALNACFTLHELNHSHWAWVNEDRFPVRARGLGHPQLEGGTADRAGGQGQGARRQLSHTGWRGLRPVVHGIPTRQGAVPE